jgi:hypothetical protein
MRLHHRPDHVRWCFIDAEHKPPLPHPPCCVENLAPPFGWTGRDQPDPVRCRCPGAPPHAGASRRARLVDARPGPVGDEDEPIGARMCRDERGVGDARVAQVVLGDGRRPPPGRTCHGTRGWGSTRGAPRRREPGCRGGRRAGDRRPGRRCAARRDRRRRRDRRGWSRRATPGRDDRQRDGRQPSWGGHGPPRPEAPWPGTVRHEPQPVKRAPGARSGCAGTGSPGRSAA